MDESREAHPSLEAHPLPPHPLPGEKVPTQYIHTEVPTPHVPVRLLSRFWPHLYIQPVHAMPGGPRMWGALCIPARASVETSSI